MRRFVSLALLVLSVSAAALAGVGGAAFRTDAGRAALTRYLAAALDGAVNGYVEVGSIGGSILEGLVIEDLVVRDTAGVLFARVPRIVARYRVADLVSRRFVLGQLIITDPHIHLLQKSPDAPFNIVDILGAGGGPPGARPLIAFEDTEIHRANIMVSTPNGPRRATDRHTPEQTQWGEMRVRRASDVNARLDYVRISSPRDSVVRLDVRSLRAGVSDPDVDVQQLRGRVDFAGDSMHVDLDELRLPDTRVSAYGFLKWPTGKIELGLNADADRFAVDDIAAFAQRLPWGMVGSGDIQLASPNPDSLSVRLNGLRMAADGGSVSGRLGITVSGGQLVEILDTDLVVDALDLDNVRPLLDSLPFQGHLSGTVSAHGPTTLLQAGVDWSFTDTAADSAPVSYVRGEGFLALGGSGPTLLNFGVDTARIDTRTIRHLFPSVRLLGHVGGSVALNGHWQNTELNGRLWHQHDSLPVSRLSGTLRFDTRTDTLGVYAELGLDSLHFPTIRPSYPLAPPAGALTGSISVAGPLPNMALTVLSSGAVGEANGSGTLSVTDTQLALTGLEGGYRNLDLSRFYPTLKPMELTGTVSGQSVVDSSGTSVSTFDFSLERSFLADAPIDSATGSVRIADSVLTTSTTVWGPGLGAMMEGRLGLAASRVGTITFNGQLDSLGTVGPAFERLAPDMAQDSLFENLIGTAQFAGTLVGSVDTFSVNANVTVGSAFSDGGVVEGARASINWSTDFADRLFVDARVDSLELGAWAFSDLGLRLDGSRARSDWAAYARLGLDGSFAGWGKAFNDGRVLILPLDSLALLLPENVWMLDHAALVSVSDSGVLFSQFTMASRNDPRSPHALSCPDRRPAVTLEGLFPTNGSAEMIAELVAVPVRDVWGLAQEPSERVAGDLCGRVVLGGTARDPVLTSAVTMRDGQLNAISIPQAAGRLAYENRRLTGNFEVRQLGELYSQVDVSLPLDLALRDVGERRLPGELSVTVRADSVDLQVVELLTETVADARGTLFANFGVRGSWEAPVLTGVASVSGGTVRLPEIGVTHRDLVGGVHLVGDSIVIDSLSVQSGSGRAGVSGLVRLDGMRVPIMDVQIDAANFHTANIPGLVNFSSSGNVSLRGPIIGATLSGRGTVTDGALYFADLIEKRIINLEDTLYAQLLDAELQALIQREGLGMDFENRFLDSLTISGLQLQMGNAVWLRSSQANVQLAGALTVNKTAALYRYDGTLNTIRGSYRLPTVSTNFAVTDGEVLYFGTPDLNAVLDINAQHDVRTVQGDILRVFVNVGGTLNDPVVTLSSDREPQLPTTEIISYLLVGAPRIEAGMTRTDDALTSGAMSSAFNVASGVISAQVERALIADLGVPIDYLRVNTEGIEGRAGFSVGRRFGERWFVIATPSVCLADARRSIGARAEYRFADDWSWSFSSDPGTSCGSLGSSSLRSRHQFGVDLFWQRRY